MAADTAKASPKKSSRSTTSKAATTEVQTPVAGSRKTAAVSKVETPDAAAPQTRRNSKKPAGTGDRQQMIAVRAYYLAEERGFVGGDCVVDWLLAEEWVDIQLRGGKPTAS